MVQVILESTLLRREKNMLDTDGKRIVELPPKEVRAWPPRRTRSLTERHPGRSREPGVLAARTEDL